MREAIGTSWTYMLVLLFTLIFTGFIVLALSYSKSYKLKNEITSIIEKYEGITTDSSNNNNNGSIVIINQYLKNSNYKLKYYCPQNDNSNHYYGVDDLDSNYIEHVDNNKKYYYCLEYDTEDCAFKITVFYQMNLPIIGDINKFSVSGKSNKIPNAYIENTKYCTD